MKDFFELNAPNYLDPKHPITSFSADQLIQFARAVGLKVSLASYSMLEDLLLKARGSSGVHPMTSRYPAAKSPFPIIAGSSMDDSISRSVYSLPTLTEIERTNNVVSGDVLEEPCSSRQSDGRLAMRPEWSEKSETDSLKTLQHNKSNGKKKKSRLCKWSREGWLKPLLHSGDDKGDYVFIE